ncbi:hypothetical protein OKW42_003592 [Paraburkholderia sp. WC7.3d]
MGLTADLDGVRHAYGLCFVRAPWAYFTRVPLDQQWGDGWERVPYEQHAGVPYDDMPEQILTVAFDGPLYPPMRATTATRAASSRSIGATPRGCARRISSATRRFTSWLA